jgi:SMC interacting uncharacterized protein involved in chromosome segregation
MRDPRVDELLEYLDETTSRGVPTRQAEMAAKVQGYLFEIEKLRSEVEVANRQVVALAAREATLRQSMAARNGVSTVAVGGASLMADDEPEFEFVRERLEAVSSNLQARRQFVKHTQDLLAARVNEVQKILDSFGGSDAGAGRTRRVRRIRRVRRRR